MKTEDLLKELENATDLPSFFARYEDEFLQRTAADYLNDLMRLKGLTVGSVAAASGVGEYVYKIFSGERKPSRDVLIALGIGMQLSPAEIQLLLRVSKFAILDGRDKRDSVIFYGLTHGYGVFQIDELLFENHLPTLR